MGTRGLFGPTSKHTHSKVDELWSIDWIDVPFRNRTLYVLRPQFVFDEDASESRHEELLQSGDKLAQNMAVNAFITSSLEAADKLSYATFRKVPVHS